MGIISSVFAASPSTTTAATTTAASSAGTSSLSSLIMLGVFFLVFYFLLWRPQSKRAKEQRNLLTGLAVGDEVITTGGIMGRINKITENVVMLMVAPNIEIAIQKAAVTSNLPKGTIKNLGDI